MPDISQLIASSYEAVANEANKPENQFRANAFLDFIKKKGGVKTIPWGSTLELTLDYQRNPGAEFIATDLSATSLAKTETLTAASYTEGQIVVPVTWTFADEAKNSSTNRKVDFVAALLENAMVSHDDLIEEALCATSATNGFNALATLFPTTGQGSPGGVDSGTETWWRHHAAAYAANGSDIVAVLTLAMKTSAKGSGGAMPNLVLCGIEGHNLYEGSQQTYVRYTDSRTADGAFVALKLMNSDVIFSEQGNANRIYGINTKNTKLYMAKGASRRMGKEVEITNQPGYSKKMYSMLQFATNNKSRNFVVYESGS
jgi:hypothetical protein